MGVLDQAHKLIRILGAIWEPRDLAPPFQQGEFLRDIVKFPGKSLMS